MQAALKPRADVTRSPKQGHHWLLKKGLMSSKNVKINLEKTQLRLRVPFPVLMIHPDASTVASGISTDNSFALPTLIYCKS